MPFRTVTALALLLASTAGGQTWGFDALRAFASLTSSQWKAVDSGRVEARVLNTDEPTEVAIVGVARLRATTACFLTQFQDIENFKKNPAVLKIHKFTTPIEPRDLAGFSLQASDLAGLPQCRLGQCNVKLSAEAISRLAREVDWSQPGHDAKAQTVFREQLFSYLETYLRLGNSALIVYGDKNKPVQLANEFDAVLDARPGLSEFVPGFREYLARYPNESLLSVRDFIYWSTESFGLKPVDSITQVFIYGQLGRAVIASKQLYASHYFDASLGLTAALDDLRNPSRPGMYLVYMNRSRIDLLSGFLAGLKRAILRDRLQDGMRKDLTEVVHKLESSCVK